MTEDQTSQAPASSKQEDILMWLKFKSSHVKSFILVILIMLLVSVSLIAVYFCYFKYIPALWKWGFDPLSWACILSVLGCACLIWVPLMPVMFLGRYVQNIIKLIAEDAETVFNQKMDEITKKQVTYEEKLEKNDELGLIPLITYSRFELEQYYKIGLSQTQRSFSYSIISMWIGFFIIVAGIMLYVFPVSIVNKDFVDGNFKILTLSSGILTEFISALFLWIYKSSISNLTYFYNRQMFIHNTLLAYKISTSMKDGDSTKTLIVGKILDFGFRSMGSILAREERFCRKYVR